MIVCLCLVRELTISAWAPYVKSLFMVGVTLSLVITFSAGDTGLMHTVIVSTNYDTVVQ